MTFLMTIVCAICPTWIGFIAVRALQGFFATAAQVLGMTVIQDMYVLLPYIRFGRRVPVDLFSQVLLRGTRSKDWNMGLVNFDWSILWSFPVFYDFKLYDMEGKLLDSCGACGDWSTFGCFSHGRNRV